MIHKAFIQFMLCRCMEVIFRELFIASVSSPHHINSLSFCLLSGFFLSLSLTLSKFARWWWMQCDSWLVALATSGNVHWWPWQRLKHGDGARQIIFDLEWEWESGGRLANHNVITEMSLFNNTDNWLTGVYMCSFWTDFRNLFRHQGWGGGGIGWCGGGAKAPGSKTWERFSIMLDSIETKPRKTGNMDSKESTGWLCEGMHRGTRECECVLLPLPCFSH